jgi:diguanylate cyclase (GGDEF)-like protein
MNSTLSNSLILVALAASVFLVVGVHFLPERSLVLAPTDDTMQNSRFFVDATKLADGNVSAEWLDRSRYRWRCNMPQHFEGDYFPCSMGVDISRTPSKGIDLSRFEYLTLHLNYSAKEKANRVRIAVRHFDPAYSKPEEPNSGKFNSVQVHTSNLGKPLRLGLDEFSVADWWIDQYNIPLSQARPELSNALAVTIDVGDRMSPGQHDFQLERLEFSGKWITPEQCYLALLALWMLGILGFTLKRIYQLRAEAAQGIQIISHLSTTNAELRQETDKFRRLSTVDPLTQTYNRFGIDKIVTTLMAASRDRYLDTPNFALILVDIDHFKRINDRRGHDVGDRILQQVSAIIQRSIRHVDFLGRWGGEEFIVILPNTDKDFAIAMAEKIRVTIAEVQFEPEQPVLVTASFGVSTQMPGEDFATTFKRADVALYRAKAQGRNCVIMAYNTLSEEG